MYCLKQWCLTLPYFNINFDREWDKKISKNFMQMKKNFVSTDHILDVDQSRAILKSAANNHQSKVVDSADLLLWYAVHA